MHWLPLPSVPYSWPGQASWGCGRRWAGECVWLGAARRQGLGQQLEWALNRTPRTPCGIPAGEAPSSNQTSLQECTRPMRTSPPALSGGPEMLGLHLLHNCGHRRIAAFSHKILLHTARQWRCNGRAAVGNGRCSVANRAVRSTLSAHADSQVTQWVKQTGETQACTQYSWEVQSNESPS